MNTKDLLGYIIAICKQYINDVLRGWGLTNEEKSLIAFEQEHMPYTRYSGNQSVDHVLFRKFLRYFGATINEVHEVVSSIGAGTKEVVEVSSEDALQLIENPLREVVYVTQDTNELFIWNGKEFVSASNKEMNGTIYVSDINELLDYEYTKEGVFSVVYIISSSITKKSKTYALTVSSSTNRKGVKSFVPTLSSNSEWAYVAYDNNLDKYWVWKEYIYKEDYDKLSSRIVSVEGDVDALMKKGIYKVVEKLPIEGEINIIYLVPRIGDLNSNIKDEYMWINGKWESIGTTSIDLEGYVTKEDYEKLKEIAYAGL